jgi:hypothetical protein
MSNCGLILLSVLNIRVLPRENLLVKYLNMGCFFSFLTNWTSLYKRKEYIYIYIYTHTHTHKYTKNRDLKMNPISTRKTKNVFANPWSCVRPYHHYHHQLQGVLLILNFLAFKNNDGNYVTSAFYVKRISAKTSVPSIITVTLALSLRIYVTYYVLISTGHSAIT